ncbi:MAG: hypothetical protein PHV34_09530 [Verrucomicrobiae bacterium]|nr:hypothetical protein [Verrucomicrobiae bacterium]
MIPIHWNPLLNPAAFGLLALAVAGFVYWMACGMARKHGKRRAFWLLAPKLAVLLLLLIALLGPGWLSRQGQERASRVLVLLDNSSSMDVVDDGQTSRARRARALLEELQHQLAGQLQWEVMPFDTEIHPPGAPPSPAGAERGTDLAGCITSLAGRPETAGYAAMLVITDGGDEAVEPARLPSIPLSILAVGAPSFRWNDVSFNEVECPAGVEQGIDFEIKANIEAKAGGKGDFAKGLDKVKVLLELEQGGKWGRISEKTVDLRHLRSQVIFRVCSQNLGRQQYRLNIPGLSGEITVRNNFRTVVVEVQKKSLRVLYYTSELGIEYKMMRGELASDPGIAFTGFFRTLNDRFTVQGDRSTGEQDLETGFPGDCRHLQRYECIIVGSFPAVDWKEPQIQALLKYVEEGGAVVFLGGENSFGRGGYAGTKLLPLFPWELSSGEPALQRGNFPVTLSSSSAQFPMMSGLKELLLQAGKANVESVNLPGSLRANAVPLLMANVGGKSVPIVALMNHGKGKVLGVATNTLWKWNGAGDVLRAAYGRFWRQGIRQLANQTEGGQNLSVQWNQEIWRPGQTAEARIVVTTAVAADKLRLTASLARDNQQEPLDLAPVPGLPGAYAAKTGLLTRGTYAFRLVAYQGNATLGSYEKKLVVAPAVDEGTHLEINNAFLENLAAKGAGLFARENELPKMADQLSRIVQKQTRTEIPLTHAGYVFPLLLLILMVAEWMIRRRANLV